MTEMRTTTNTIFFLYGKISTRNWLSPQYLKLQILKLCIPLPPPAPSPIPFLRGPHRKTAFVLSCKQNPFKGQTPFQPSLLQKFLLFSGSIIIQGGQMKFWFNLRTDFTKTLLLRKFVINDFQGSHIQLIIIVFSLFCAKETNHNAVIFEHKII